MQRFCVALGVFLLIPTIVLAQIEQKKAVESTTTEVKKSHKIDTKYRKKLEKLFNAKVYNDPFIMSKVLNSVASENQKKENFENVNFETFFTTQDTSRLKEGAKNINSKSGTGVSETVKQQVWGNPQDAYIDAIMNQEVPMMQQQEISEISKVDKQAVSNFMMMMTDAGPELGNQQVSVQYDGIFE